MAKNKKKRADSKKNTKKSSAKKITKKESNERIPLSKKQLIIIGSIVILAILLLTYGTKLVLYVNFLLGNDIVITLDTNKEYFNVFHGKKEKVDVTATVTTNPFCSAYCDLSFRDLSTDKILDEEDFLLYPGIPLKKTYELSFDGYTEKRNFYRFDMECVSKKTFFCASDGLPTARTILITTDYSLTEKEWSFLRELKTQLTQIDGEFIQHISELETTSRLSNQLDTLFLGIDWFNSLNNLLGKSREYYSNFQGSKDDWKVQDFSSIDKKISDSNKILSTITKLGDQLAQKTISISKEYSSLRKSMMSLSNDLNDLVITYSKESELTALLKEEVDLFYDSVLVFNTRNSLDTKKKSVEKAMSRISEIGLKLEELAKGSFEDRAIRNYFAYESLCNSEGICLSHINISDYTYNDENYKLLCNETSILRQEYLALIHSNSSINPINISTLAYSTKKSKEEIIVNQTTLDPELFANISDSYITSTSINAFFSNLPSECNKLDPSLIIGNLDIPEISTPIIEEPAPITFDPPEKKCCIYGKCTDCNNNISENYPIVLIHGHAFNKDIAFDYSLESFNKIQNKLEEESIVNSGSISVYTSPDSPYGIWSGVDDPFSVKLTYYFDLFHEPGNYVVVQTKSENVETYSVRLKELIENVLYRTGKDKVIIVAHSMGGLVTRRYIQLFGEDKVAKVILVTVPNKGIEGNVADYCKVTGEKLECRDMNKQSLFINKLSRVPLPSIPIVNIVGQGCEMEGEDGDGIVMKKNAILEAENVENYFIEGTCKGMGLLHNRILHIDEYPELYDILTKEISE